MEGFKENKKEDKLKISTLEEVFNLTQEYFNKKGSIIIDFTQKLENNLDKVDDVDHISGESIQYIYDKFSEKYKYSRYEKDAKSDLLFPSHEDIELNDVFQVFQEQISLMNNQIKIPAQSWNKIKEDIMFLTELKVSCFIDDDYKNTEELFLSRF